MKVREVNSKERVVTNTDSAKAIQDMVPDIMKGPENDLARSRLLDSVQKHTASPIPTEVPEEHKLDVSGTTSITHPVSDNEILTRATNNLGDEWVRQDLPSRSVPYGLEQVYLKPFNVRILSRVHAAMRGNQFTHLIDALASCVSIDIRRLTPPDLNFVMYWLRMNSYTRSPYEIPWTSKYGNENKHTIKDSNLEIVELIMKPTEFESWKKKGICFPTVRDMELLQTENIPEEDRWEIEMAQYVEVPIEPVVTYVDRKLELIENSSISMIEDIKEFSRLINHGVNETAKVTDTKFEATAAIAHIRATVVDTRNMIRAILQNDIAQDQELGLMGMSQRADILEAEANDIQRSIDEGHNYKPMEETIAISMNAMAFFP